MPNEGNRKSKKASTDLVQVFCEVSASDLLKKKKKNSTISEDLRSFHILYYNPDVQNSLSYILLTI